MQLSNITNPAEGWSSIDTSVGTDSAVSEPREYTPEERAAIEARLHARGSAVAVTRRQDMLSWYTELHYPNGRVVVVYDEAPEDQDKVAVQCFEGAERYKLGEPSATFEF